MDIYVRILGLDLFSLHVSTGPAAEEAATDGGYLTSTPIGFTGTHETPDEAGPYREGW